MTPAELDAANERLKWESERAALKGLLLEARDCLCTHTDPYDISLIHRIDAALGKP